MNSYFLIGFLVVNAFVIGLLSAIAWRHARAHFRPEPHETAKPLANVPQVHLPISVRDRIIEEAEQTFQAELNRSVGELQEDLKTTSTHLNEQLQQLGSEVAISERGRYYNMLEELRKRTGDALATAQAEIAKNQQELNAQLAQDKQAMQAKMAEELAAEKKRILEQIDTKLADAVGSFLTETLQHNVDLGAQAAYLTAMLEEHKADFKKEVDDGPADAAK